MLNLEKESARAFLSALPRLGRMIKGVLVQAGYGEKFSLPQFIFLRTLVEEGDTNPGDIARRLLVTMPAVTSLADYLVERGWVERKPDPIDRRKWVLSITADGREAYEELSGVLEQSLVEAFRRLTPKDRKRLASALRDLDELSWVLMAEAAGARER